ncbi:MAG TPA: hypothetical protein ACQGQH_02050 [Xylella sp.]
MTFPLEASHLRTSGRLGDMPMRLALALATTYGGDSRSSRLAILMSPRRF